MKSEASNLGGDAASKVKTGPSAVQKTVSIMPNVHSELDELLWIFEETLQKMGDLKDWRRPTPAEELSEHIGRHFPLLRQKLLTFVRQIDWEQQFLANVLPSARSMKRLRSEWTSVDAPSSIQPQEGTPEETLSPPSKKHKGMPSVNSPEIASPASGNHLRNPNCWNDTPILPRHHQQVSSTNAQHREQINQYQQQMMLPTVTAEMPPELDISNNPSIQLLEVKQYEANLMLQNTETVLIQLHQKINTMDQALFHLQKTQELHLDAVNAFDGLKKIFGSRTEIGEKEMHEAELMKSVKKEEG